MKPTLLLINGIPGMGKSTLAQKYIDNHPLALNLDIDKIWFMLGQWQTSRPRSDELKMKYAYTLTKMHLAAGFDVVVPQYFKDIRKIIAFERIATVHNVAFKEIALVTDLNESIERFKRRGRAQGYPSGFRPGGVLDTAGGEFILQEMNTNVIGLLALRTQTIQIEPRDGDIDGTYNTIIEAITKSN